MKHRKGTHKCRHKRRVMTKKGRKTITVGKGSRKKRPKTKKSYGLYVHKSWLPEDEERLKRLKEQKMINDAALTAELDDIDYMNSQGGGEEYSYDEAYASWDSDYSEKLGKRIKNLENIKSKFVSELPQQDMVKGILMNVAKKKKEGKKLTTMEQAALNVRDIWNFE